MGAHMLCHAGACTWMGRSITMAAPRPATAVNIEQNPNVSVHLESGMEAIILEGTSRPAEKPSPEFGRKLSEAYKKYKDLGYTPGPNSWDEGGLFVFTPRQCIAWSKFT